MLRACSLALLGTVANAALVPRNMASSRGVSGAFTAKFDGAYVNHASFVAATVQAMSAELGLDWQRVQVDQTKLVERRRAQATGGSSDVEILYTVACSADCNKIKADLGKLDAGNMNNIIAKVNEHAADNGFTSVVQSTAAEIAANIPPPTFVDIIVPTCPPGMESALGSLTRAQLIQTGAGACTDIDGCKNKPCGATCYDVAAPDTGYTCSDCPAKSGLPTTGTDKTPNAQCNKGTASVACITGTGSSGSTCLDVNDCARTPTGPPAGPCGWNGNSCKDTSLTSTTTDFTCQCKTGYTFVVGKGCIQDHPCDVNPCSPAGTAKCTGVKDSTGKWTGHVCTCPSPTAYSVVNKTVCVDADGCGLSPCIAGVPCFDETANNEMKSGKAYTCKHPDTQNYCPPGYTPNKDGKTCKDVRPCVTGDPCGMKTGHATACTSGLGIAYKCTCVTGYIMEAGTCAAKKACNSFDGAKCDPLATCNDIGHGQHVCICPKSDPALGWRQRAYWGDGSKSGVAATADALKCDEEKAGVYIGGTKNFLFTAKWHGTFTFDACGSGAPCKDVIAATRAVTTRRTGAEMDRCSPLAEMHETRCCSDKAIKGWRKVKCLGKDLYTESDAKGFGGCQHAMNFASASKLCSKLGSRLCTRAEVAAQCTRGTGCGHDGDLIWTSTNELALSHASCHKVVPATKRVKEKERCAVDAEKHETRCCSSTKIAGYKRKRCQGKWMWTESDSKGFNGCQHNLDWTAAAALCDSMGARLCTRNEIKAQCTRGTGCNHDSDLIWSKDTSNQKVYVEVRNLDGTKVAADSSNKCAVTLDLNVGNVLVNVVVPTKSANVVLQSRCPATKLTPVKIPKGCVDYNGCDSNGKGLSPCFDVPGGNPLKCTDTPAKDMLKAKPAPGYSCEACPSGYQPSGSGDAWECGPDAKGKYSSGLKGMCKGRVGCADKDDCAGNPCGVRKQRDGSILKCHDIERGNTNAREKHRCATHNEKHEVRCCSDTPVAGFVKRKCNGADMWTESDGKAIGGCKHSKTYAQALAICTKAKARLCTQAELYSSCTRGTGCGHDADLIWASTTVLNLAGTCKDMFPKPNEFKCTCYEGFTLEGGVCVGKAACTPTERATCDPMALCQLRGDGTGKIAFDCLCPAGVSRGNGKKKRNRFDRKNGCVDINKCAGHPKKRKCGIGLNKAWYANSMTPCRDNPAVKELKDKIDFTCPKGCPYGTTDANPRGKFKGRTCRDIDDCRASSSNTVRTLNQCSGGLDTKVYKKIKCVDEGAGQPKCKCDAGQKEMHVTRCHDIAPATEGARELERCAVDEETHEVRCCSDKAIGGWAKRKCNGKDMWTESDGTNFGGCMHRSTWNNANKQCNLKGARLCTRAEIKSKCTRGTGCGHDADLIWAGTMELKPCHDVGRGNTGAKEFERCAAHSEVHEVRCCSDKVIAGWAKRTCNKKAMWTESDGKNFGGCQHAMGYVAARDFCAGLGARLCTRAEFKSGCTRGTGCGHDADLIWASTTGTKACHDVIKATNNARGLQRCAPHDEKHEVRCCSSKYIKGYKRTRCQGRWLWTESNSAGFGGCQHNRNYKQAYDKCASMGARLCSKAEVWNQCTRGTGCNHDTDLLWTSTSELVQGAQCQSACSTAPNLKGDAFNLCMGAVGNAVGQAKVLALCKVYGVGQTAYLTAKALASYGVTEADAQTVKAGAIKYFGTSCAKEAAGLKTFCPLLAKSMGVSGTETLVARADYGTYPVRCRGRGKVGGKWKRVAKYQAVFRFDLTKGMAMSVVVKDNKPQPGSTDKRPATSIQVRTGAVNGNCGAAQEKSCNNKKKLTASYHATDKAESVYFVVNAADKFPITIEYKEWDPNAACTAAVDMSKLSQGKDGYVLTMPAASTPPTRTSCGKGAAQQILKMRVKAGASFTAFLPDKKRGTFLAIRDGSICPGNNEDMCTLGQMGSPVHWQNSGTQGAWAYVLVEGPAGAKVKVQWELDGAKNSCASPITEADFSSMAGGGQYKHFMKLPTVRSLSCPSGSAKRGPEEVFKISVPKDMTLTFRVMQFKSNLPNTNFFKVGMKWGGACPGNKYVKCQGSLPGADSKVIWSNDQATAQDAFISLVAESRGKRECMPYKSPNTAKYKMRNIPLGADKAVIFSVKAKNDAHIGFFSDKKGLGEVYEIVLSGWGNKHSAIRERNRGPNKVWSPNLNFGGKKLLSPTQFRDFWADAVNGLVRVGKGITIGQNVLMKWQDPKHHVAKYVGFMTGWGATGDWRVCNLQASNDAVRQSKYISGSYAVDYQLKLAEKAQACDAATKLVGRTGRKTEPTLYVGHFKKTYVSGCGAATAPGSKTKLYKVDVPAGKSAQMSLIGTTFAGQLIYEGRIDPVAGACPGTQTVFCGTIDGSSRSVNSWYNAATTTVALYIVVEEPKAKAGLSCKNYNTFNNRRYTMRNIALDSDKTVVFSFKGRNDAHIGFFSPKRNNNEMYEIVLGGWGNKKSQIRARVGGDTKKSWNGRVVDPKKYVDFWASALNGLVRVGKGKVPGKNLMQQWQDPKPHTSTWVGLKTGWGSAGDWRICQAMGSGGAKPFQLTWDMTKTAPVCNLVPRMDCATSNLYIVSHRGKTLSDNKGTPSLAAGLKEDWQAWDLEDAGAGQWFVKSHSGRKLEDRNDKVGLHDDVGAWQKWTITPAGGGKFFFTGHRQQRLEDRNNVLGVHQHKGGWQKWTVTTKEDMAPCLSTAILTPRTFKMFKFNLINVRWNWRANSVQIGELQLRGDDNKEIRGASASNPGGRSPGRETPAKAVDRNHRTKWLDFNKKPLILSFKTAQTVKDYRWRSANDAIERDPARWQFEGSNDGATWTVLESKWAQKTYNPRRNRYRWQNWNSLSSKVQLKCEDQSCADHDKWKNFNSEIENSNFFKTDCCADGACGSDTVFKFDVPFGAKLTAKVTTQAWLAKYQLKSEGSCVASAKGSPGTKAVAKGACYTSSTSNNAGSEMSFYDAGQDDKPQMCHNIARGRGTSGSNAVGGKQGTYSCAHDTQKHEVRCCSDKLLKNGKRNWVKRSAKLCGTDIWTESDLSTGKGNGAKCHHSQTWAQADQLCSAQGARLCSLNEITNPGCTSGTGCGHDGDLIWTGDQEIATNSCHDLIKGSTANRRNEIERCAPDFEEHETRCCSDTNKRKRVGRRWQGMARKRCSPGGVAKWLWADSSGGLMGGCKHSFTWNEANAYCTAQGMRLCTAPEMKADCTRGTGCNHDNDLIWTSTKTLLDAAPGNPPATAVYLTVEGATPKEGGKFKVDYKLTFGTAQTGCGDRVLADMDKKGQELMRGARAYGKTVYYSPSYFARAYPSRANYQTTLEHGPVGTNVASNMAQGMSDPAGSYRWLRFNILRKTRRRSNSVQMAELAFYDAAGKKLNPYASSNPGGRMPRNERDNRVRDNNRRTKWLDFRKQPIILKFRSNVSPKSYKWMTANDANERDPTRWIIEGTNDGRRWTAIDQTYGKKTASVTTKRYAWIGPFAIPVTASRPIGRPCMGDSGGRTDALTRYTGHGVVHKIKVPLAYRLQFRVVRHLPTYNFLVAISSTATATPTCPGMFKACLVNGRTRWWNNAYRSTYSPWNYYPSNSAGTKLNEDVYVTVQAENTVVQTNGYWIEYYVCKKGTSILGKGLIPTRGRNRKKGLRYTNRWWNCPRSL